MPANNTYCDSSSGVQPCLISEKAEVKYDW